MKFEGRQRKGVTQVKDALKKSGVRGGRRIVTSMDKGIADTREDLQRTRMHRGWRSWQIPVVLGPYDTVLEFISVGEPGAIVPEHSHEADLFRWIISGSLIVGDLELTQGHWMFVPLGTKYKAEVGQLGVTVAHAYGLTTAVPLRPKRVTSRRSASRSVQR
jgi:hypothetical protein